MVVQQLGGERRIRVVGVSSTVTEQRNQVAGAVEVFEIEVVGGTRADDQDGAVRVLQDDALDHGATVEQRGGIDVGGALRLGQRDGAVGGAVDQAAAGNAFGQQCLGRRMHEAGQGVGVEFSRQHIRALGKLLCSLQRGAAVERRDDFTGAMRQRGDDGGGGEQDVEHHHHLAFEALGVEFFLFQQDMNFLHAQPSSFLRSTLRTVTCAVAHSVSLPSRMA